MNYHKGCFQHGFKVWISPYCISLPALKQEAGRKSSSCLLPYYIVWLPSLPPSQDSAQFRYFVVDNSLVVGFLEEPFTDEEGRSIGPRGGLASPLSPLSPLQIPSQH